MITYLPLKNATRDKHQLTFEEKNSLDKLSKMKKYLFFIAFFFLAFNGVAQHINDPNFAQAIRYDCPSCVDSANNLTADARKRNGLTISIHDISDLSGIEGFTSLTFLNCTNNNLTTLPDNLPPNLTYINVNFNKITNLKKIPNGVKQFNCSNNSLTVLPEIPISVLMLDCSNNKITTIPPLNNVHTLACTDNLITVLPTLPNTMQGLFCSYNKLKTLPNLPRPLIRLSCQYNLDLKCLPLLPDNLVYLDISKNIVCLPNIVKNLAVDVYVGLNAQSVNLPICNNLRPLPCDTFPQTIPKNPSILGLNTAKITIFPNPTEGGIKIKCQNCTLKKVSIFNTIGQLVLETQTALLDMTDLGSGMYIVRVETIEGNRVVEKIMKM